MSKQDVMRTQVHFELGKIVYKTEKGVTVGRKQNRGLDELQEVATYCGMPLAATSKENEILDWFAVNPKSKIKAAYFTGQEKEKFREQNQEAMKKTEELADLLNDKIGNEEKKAAAKRKELDDKADIKRKELDTRADLKRKGLDDKAATKRKELDVKAAAKRK